MMYELNDLLISFLRKNNVFYNGYEYTLKENNNTYTYNNFMEYFENNNNRFYKFVNETLQHKMELAKKYYLYCQAPDWDDWEYLNDRKPVIDNYYRNKMKEENKNIIDISMEEFEKLFKPYDPEVDGLLYELPF